MHNRIFIQIYASAVWVEHLALYLRFVNFSCLCSAVSAASRALSLSRSRARSSLAVFLVLAAMVSELSAWNHSQYTCSLQAAKQRLQKRAHVFPIRPCACTWTYNIRYIYIYPTMVIAKSPNLNSPIFQYHGFQTKSPNFVATNILAFMVCHLLKHW